MQVAGRTTGAKAFFPLQSNARRNVERPWRRLAIVKAQVTPPQKQDDDAKQLGMAAVALTSLVTPFLLDTGDAQAIGGSLGILEGRILSLTHPALMGFLFGASIYAGVLGLKWRRVRELVPIIKVGWWGAQAYTCTRCYYLNVWHHAAELTIDENHLHASYIFCIVTDCPWLGRPPVRVVAGSQGAAPRC
jgi:hypothetical protein